MSIIQSFLKQVMRTPAKPAIIQNDCVVTYQELYQKVSSLSASLLELGVKKNDHVAVLLPNSIEFSILMLTAANMGIVLVPQAMSLSNKALSKAIIASDIRHFFVWHALIPDLDTLRNCQAREESILVAVGESTVCNDANYLNFDVLLHGSPDLSMGAHDVCPDQAFILTMTSGSTGDPKPIILSQAVKEKRAKAAIELYSLTNQDIVLIATPMYHSLAERLLIMPLIVGGSCVIMSTYSAEKWVEKVHVESVTFSIIVSSQLKQVVTQLASSGQQINSLRCLVSSSERLPDNVRDKVLKLLNCDFHECYGASEIAIATNLNYQKNYVNSVGQAAKDVDIKILGKEGKTLPAGEVGEILCKTPMLFSGYYKKERETNASMHGQYFCTGDLGRLDNEGFLSFLGRKKDIIITGGINVYPKDVEDVILQHEAVSACAVIPIEDESFGELITAVVVLKEGMEVSIRALQRLSAKCLADFQQPRQYFFTDDLPKNAMGKIMKQRLIELYSSKISMSKPFLN